MWPRRSPPISRERRRTVGIKFHLYLFGRFRLLRGDPPEEQRIPTLHGRRLLAVLATREHTPVHRGTLAGLLFPDMPESRARRALNQALWRVRKSLGPEAVAGDHEILRLGEGMWVDVVAFLRGSRSEQVEDWVRAVDLYQGDFWPECYEDWAVVERERLRGIYLTLLERLIHHYKRLGEYERALYYAREAIREEPLREGGHKELIHLYLLQNRPLDALRQYEALRVLLREEFGVEPSAELQSLRRSIEDRLRRDQQLALSPLFSGEGRIPFVGRHEERERLLERVEQALRGRGGFVLLEGPPGMGKSRLLEEVAEGARWRGMWVGYGQTPSQPAGPFRALKEAVASLLSSTCVATLRRVLPAAIRDTAAHLWPELGTPSANVAPQHMRNALVQVILNLTQCAPVLLLLDDIQNADVDVLHVLRGLCPDIHHTPLLIVLAFRPLETRVQEPLWSELLALDRHASPVHITLSLLDEGEKRLLIAAALNVSVQDPIVDRLARVVDRVPLSILETLRYLHRRGALQRSTSGAWELTRTDVPLPPSIPSLVQGRLERLPRSLRHILQFLAILGERIPCALLAQVVPERRIHVIEDLVRYGFLSLEGDECRFVHALVQEAVYTTIPPEQRKRLHQRAAELLHRRQPLPWDRIAFHLERAGRPLPAAQAHLRAAQVARRVYAHAQVIRHCDAATRLVSRPDPAICDAWRLRAEAHMLTGEIRHARGDIARALYLARCLHDTRRLAQAALLGGKIAIRDARFSQAQRLLLRARTLFQHLGDARGQAEAALALADVADTRGDLEAARAFIESAMHLAETHTLPQERARALARAGLIAAREGHVEEAERYYEEGSRQAHIVGDLHVQGICVNGLGLMYLDRRRHREATDAFRQALNLARQLADGHNESVTRLNLAVAATHAGRLTEGYELGQTALKLARRVGNERSRMLAHLLLGAIETTWGNFAAAREHLRRGEEIARSKNYRAGQGYVLRNLGAWAREQGRMREAVQWGEEGLNVLLGHHLTGRVPVAAYALGRSLLLAREFARAVEILHRAYRLNPPPPMRAFLLAALAWAQAETGEEEQARGNAKEAIRLLDTVEEDLYLPHAWYHLYRALHTVLPEEASPLLRNAYLALQAQCLHVPEERQPDFLHRVLSHRLISQAWLGQQSRPVERLRLHLPRRDGPGRVQVTWTVDAGDEDAVVEAQYGPIALRRHRLARLLHEAEAQGARPTHEDLAQVLGVSVPTIRRDLAALRAE